jgi:hypothetical protein
MNGPLDVTEDPGWSSRGICTTERGCLGKRLFSAYRPITHAAHWMKSGMCASGKLRCSLLHEAPRS